MTYTIAPPPPSAPEPATTDFNAWAKFWYYVVGVNVIPAKTMIKKTWIRWKEDGYQKNPISEEQFQKWIDNNEFRDGIAVMAGKVWRGQNAGKYFIFVDLDNQKAIDDFCTRNGQKSTLQKIASEFIVEQHPDNPHKAHVYFYSEKPFVVKASDNGKPGFDSNTMPMFEVKGEGEHGIAFCTPSFHQGGQYRYQIIGTTQPITLETKTADELMMHINEVCKRYGLHYLNAANDVNDTDGGGPTVADLVKEGSVVFAGNNRHLALVKMGMSVVSLLAHKYPRSTIKEIVFQVLNQEHCEPPIDRDQFERNIWKSVERYLPPDEKQEESAAKHLEEIASDTGLDLTKVLEKPLADVIRKSYGEWIVSKAKIVGVSPPYKLISKVTLRCPKCGHEEIEDYSKMPLMSYRQTKKMCSVCVDKTSKPISDLSALFDHADAKSITLQDAEMRDDLERLHVILLEDMTRNVRAGETATITGKMTVLNPTGAGGKKPTAAMYARHIKYEREEEAPITDDDIMLFRDFVRKHGVKTPDELVKMFAPQVMGHEDAKLGLLRSAVNVRETKHLTGIRSRTHTALAGDPGTAKSTLAEEAIKIVPNSRYVTAQHVSIKSVLAIIDKDPDGGKMLMLGAVPQARNALCAINEIGSMVFEDQQHLADVLEEGKFTKDQHGIYQEIDSPTTIIATTNPEGGKWNGTPSLDQIPIKSNIRDRFDQTYVFKAFVTPEELRAYAMFKAELYQDSTKAQPDYDFLRRYLQYAAILPDPVLTPEAGTMLSDFWIAMSKDGYVSNRGYDALIRIARGQARLQLRTEIDAEIARQTIVDVKEMYKKLGRLVDPSVENPIEIAYNEVIQYANTLQVPITLEEALKHVAFLKNDSVKQYLGGNNINWSIDYNKRYRHIHDRFADGADVGQIKKGRNEQALVIYKIKPLTIAKVAKETLAEGQQQIDQKPEGLKDPRSDRSDTGTVIEQSKRQMSATDPTDRDLLDKKELQIHAILQILLKDQETFTEDDWVFKCSMWPNLDWKITDAGQTLKQLVKQGKLIELEGGNYKPT